MYGVLDMVNVFDKKKNNRDWKIVTILVLVLLLIGVGSWIGYTFIKAKENGLVLQGAQQGRIIGQQDVIRSIQTTGYFAFDAANQQGENQQVVLVGQLMTPEQLQQFQNTQKTSQ